EAAEQFRQAAQIHVAGGVEQALKDVLDRRLEAIVAESKRDQRVVMRPNRSVVIGHGIVARLAERDRAYAPAAEEMRLHQVRRDHPSAVFADHAAEQKLTGIGRPYPARPLVAVERERVGAEFVAPECLLEA